MGETERHRGRERGGGAVLPVRGMAVGAGQNSPHPFTLSSFHFLTIKAFYPVKSCCRPTVPERLPNVGVLDEVGDREGWAGGKDKIAFVFTPSRKDKRNDVSLGSERALNKSVTLGNQSAKTVWEQLPPLHTVHATPSAEGLNKC